VLPLASADHAGLVVYIGTMSKILAPGLRIGYVVAPPAVLRSVGALRSLLDIQGDFATEAAVAALIEDGELARHIARVRRVYANRREILSNSNSAERSETTSNLHCPTAGWRYGPAADVRRRRGVGAPQHAARCLLVHRPALCLR
jgi:DNA-binding transcriptional MocR family regulator